MIDSQIVQADTMVNEAVGYNGAQKKKGRKRHTVVDTLGLVMRVVVTAASVAEREGGKRVLTKVYQMSPQHISRLGSRIK